MPPSRRDDIVTDVLDHVTNTLSGTKSLLDFVPVPGLSAAADVLLAILGQIKVRLCTQIAGGMEGLRSFIDEDDESQQGDSGGYLEGHREPQRDHRQRDSSSQ